MDLLRRSFRRGSVHKPKREPLAESPSFDSPLEERDQISQLRAPTSPMDRLRRSFRRNFRSCRQTFTDSSIHLPSPTVMDRIRSSFRRSFRQKSKDRSSFEMSPSDRLRQSFRRMKRQQEAITVTTATKPTARLDKPSHNFRRSFRWSQKEPQTSSTSSRLQYWQSDEMDVRAGTCFFNVKYLGCVEVFEPRGILMCEEAFKMLKKSRKRAVKSILFISVSGLRVVEKNTRGLIVDQSIDMLSFCGPVRLHDRGFSFICLNVATLKWMCYCFIAKESGDRLSNAVGYAFAIYFERKKSSDKECAVAMNFDLTSATFTRIGSFRRQSAVETLRQKSNANTIENDACTENVARSLPSSTTIININNNINADFDENKENIPCRAFERARTVYDFERSLHSVSAALRRQRSLRELPRPNHNSVSSSPFFRRQASLRLRELPSNIERVKSLSAEFTFDAKTSSRYHTHVSPIAELSPADTPDRSTFDARRSSIGCEVAVRRQLAQKFEPQRKSEANQIDIAEKPQEDNLSVEANVSNDSEQVSNDSEQSQHPSAYSSIEGITLTPPATPSPARLARLLEPDPWSSNVARKSNAVLTTELPTMTNPVFSQPCRQRSHSLSYAEDVSRRNNHSFSDGWSLWTTNEFQKRPLEPEQKMKKKNTNPFLPNSPDAAEEFGS